MQFRFGAKALAAQYFSVVFQGETVSGADEAKVRENLARLFKTDPERIGHLFSSSKSVLKNNIDGETAQKYKLALAKLGAVAEVIPLGGKPGTAEAPKQPEPAPKSPETANARATSEPVPDPEPKPSEQPTKESIENAPPMAVAPPAQTESVQTEPVQTEIVQTEIVQTETAQTETAQTETVQTETVQTGSAPTASSDSPSTSVTPTVESPSPNATQLAEAARRPPARLAPDADGNLPPSPVAPDYGLAEAGAQLVEASTVEPANIDTSHLDMADVGVDLAEKVSVPPPSYDLSELDLEPMPANFG